MRKITRVFRFTKKVFVLIFSVCYSWRKALMGCVVRLGCYGVVDVIQRDVSMDFMTGGVR